MDFRDMDRAWMIFTKMPQGPFGLMDAIGLDVVFDLLMSYCRESKSPQDHPPQSLKDMIDRNQLGRKTGQGFYTYPHPEFIRPDFLPRPL
jgi:3-hydroxybutyryl-CoA dehydrogenase